MPLGINETLETETYKSKHLVYKEGVRVRYPSKDKEIIACILPALADPKDKTSYVGYRDEENPNLFTKWAVGIKMHPFVNKEQNIISPHTFDPEAYDPIDDLIKVAKADPEYCFLAGYTPDGKRIVNAYKNPEVRLNTKWSGYVVNALVLFDREIDQDKAVILQIPGTAFRKSGKASKDSAQSWGLLSELQRKNRKTDSDGADSYYWGDITDPRGMIPCCLKLTPNPAGGISIYNMVPVDDEEPVSTNKATLETRYNLDEIFHEVTEAEIIDRLIFYFADAPKLLRRTFAHRVPNLDRMLSKATASYSTLKQAEEEEDASGDEAFVPRPKSKKVVEEDSDNSESERSFAPADSDLPPPVTKASAKVLDEDEEDEEEEEKEITVPKRKKAASADSPKKLSMRDLMN